MRTATTNTSRVVDTSALFIMVGALPNTEWLSGLVNLDDKGFVITGAGVATAGSHFATSRPGIFAVGDVRAGSVKRVASAVGEGFLAELGAFQTDLRCSSNLQQSAICLIQPK